MAMISEEKVARLLQAARAAQQRAYSPYSRFRVGAALLTDRENIVAGCNVENVSFGLTRCAEQTAVQRAVVEDAGRPMAIVVVGDSDDPLTPCGACRQILAEFNPSMEVVCISRTGRRFETTVRELLPGAFDRDSLHSGQMERS